MDMTLGKVQQISGKVDRVIFHSSKSGWFSAVLATDVRNVTVTGTSSKEPALGAFWTITGKFEDSKYGLQFKSMEIAESFPEDVSGIVAFLKNIDGVGDVRARKIVEYLGSDTLKKLSENPAILIGFAGINDGLAKTIGEYVSSNKNIAEVESVLASMGLGMKGRQRVIEEYGVAEIARMIKENPYLMISLPRVTFTKVDSWVLRTKRFDANSVERGAAVVAESILRLAERYGHTFSELDQVISHTKTLKLAAPIADSAVSAGVDAGVSNGMLSRIGHSGIALRYLAEAEEKSASIIRKWNADTYSLGSVQNIDPVVFNGLTAEQKLAVENAINTRVSGLTGGPGTGKTHTSKAILAAFGGATVFVVAPTGKAARRANELTGRPSSTIHRFIGSTISKIRKGLSPEEVIPQVVLIDETSMVSVELFAELLEVLDRRSGTRLVIVGDVDQLPSIQPGRVLADIIESKSVPFIRLTEVKRQGNDSLIVKNAARINAGENGISLETGNDFVTFYNNDAKGLRNTLINYLTKSLVGEGWDPIKDVQVLSGMRKGTVGTIELNEQIRAILNPSHASKTQLMDKDGNSILRVGDKVMVTENNYELGVVNGDQGVVKEIHVAPKWEDNKVLVVLDSGAEVVFENGDINTLIQSWAMTVHKSQGSEYPVVLVVAHKDTSWALQRALLYTAITRGKTRVVVFGTAEDVQKATLAETELRYTRLSGLLREAA